MHRTTCSVMRASRANKNKRMQTTSSGERKDGLRRSLRIRLKVSNASLDVRSPRKPPQRKGVSFSRKVLPLERSEKKLRRGQIDLKKSRQGKATKKISINSQRDKRKPKPNRQKDRNTEVTSNSHLAGQKKSISFTQTESTKEDNCVSGKSTMRRKRDSVKKYSTSPDSGSPNLHDQTSFTATKMKAVFLNSFSTERYDYSRKETIRFVDIAFLDETRILAIDDNFTSQESGHRICCFNLDGELLCELPLPAHPWSVVVINPKEAVVTVRDMSYHGLIWLSVDLSNRSMGIVRNIPLEEICFGLAFNGEVFAVSYNKKNYISLFSVSGKEVGRVTVKAAENYRCLFLNDQDTLIYADHHRFGAVRCSNLDGREMFSIEDRYCGTPTGLAKDRCGNIFVGYYGDTGTVSQFSRQGEHIGDMQMYSVTSLKRICGLAINCHSDLMAISHEHFISLYKLLKEEGSE